MLEELKRVLIDYVEVYKNKNSIKAPWRTPLIACAYAKDPLFLQLKKLIGDFHNLPNEMLKGAKSVIIYFIPFNVKLF